MNYTETKEQSAEILRAVLGTMGQHDAAFNPITFALWYEYLAGINPGLKQAVDHCLQREPRDDAPTSTAPALQRPQEVGILARVDDAHAPVRGHDLRLDKP